MVGSSSSDEFIFSDDELQGMSGVRKSDDFVEVLCGCTSRKYGDAVGKLRVYANGDLFINCDCRPGCNEVNLTPIAFEKHSDKESARWKQNIWVMIRGKKVPLRKTALLRYYDEASLANGLRRGRRSGQSFHRDEFLKCTVCQKERRFRLRTAEECRIYHDAMLKDNWKCSDQPFESINCDDDEERPTRKVIRGCPHAALCEGCISCVCFGCLMCRFEDCICNDCMDFIQNAYI